MSWLAVYKFWYCVRYVCCCLYSCLLVPLGVMAGEEGREVILVTWDLELGAGE